MRPAPFNSENSQKSLLPALFAVKGNREDATEDSSSTPLSEHAPPSPKFCGLPSFQRHTCGRSLEEMPLYLPVKAG